MPILRSVWLPTSAANRLESRVDRASTPRRGHRGRGTPTLSDIRLMAACNTMIGKIQFELSELLGIDVDVLTPAALPERLREKVLAEAQPV